MKKILIVLISFFIVLNSFNIFADEKDSKEMIFSFEKDSNYEWTIPTDTEISSLAIAEKLDGNVSITKAVLTDKTALKISLDNSENVNNMNFSYADDNISYELSKDDNNWRALNKGDEIISAACGELDAEAGETKEQPLFIKITDVPKKAGIYEDVLSFVAEIIDTLDISIIDEGTTAVNARLDVLSSDLQNTLKEQLKAEDTSGSSDEIIDNALIFGVSADTAGTINLDVSKIVNENTKVFIYHKSETNGWELVGQGTGNTVQCTFNDYSPTMIIMENEENIELGPDEFYVEFRSFYWQLLSSGICHDISGLLDLIPVNTPGRTGYEFETWKINNTTTIDDLTMENINTFIEDGKIVLMPTYHFLNQPADVKLVEMVDGSEIRTIQLSYSIGNIANFQANNYEGMEFVRWAELVGSTMVELSTNRSYSMHVSKDRTIYAVYSTVEQRKEHATLTVSTSAETGYKILIQVERSVPNNGEYELLEHGILYCTSASWAAGKSDEEIENALMFISEDNVVETMEPKYKVKRTVGGNTIRNGGLDLHLNIGETHTTNNVYVRGYIIFSKNGVIKIIYSDVWRVSYQGLQNGEKYIIPSSTKDE